MKLRRLISTGVDADGAGGAVVQPEFDELLDFPQEVDVVPVCYNDGSRNPIRSAAFIGAIHFDRRWNLGFGGRFII